MGLDSGLQADYLCWMKCIWIYEWRSYHISNCPLGSKVGRWESWQWGKDVVRESSWGLWLSLWRSLFQLIYLGGKWVDLCIINSTEYRSFSVTFSFLWINQRPSNSLTDAHKQEKGLLKQPKCQTKPYELKIQKQKPSLRILAKCLEDNNSNVVELPSKSPDHKLKRNCV